MSTQQYSIEKTWQRVKIIPFESKVDRKAEMEDLFKDPILQTPGGLYADTDLVTYHNRQPWPVTFDIEQMSWNAPFPNNPQSPDFGIPIQNTNTPCMSPTFERGQQIRVWSELRNDEDGMEEVD